MIYLVCALYLRLEPESSDTNTSAAAAKRIYHDITIIRVTEKVIGSSSSWIVP